MIKKVNDMILLIEKMKSKNKQNIKNDSKKYIAKEIQKNKEKENKVEWLAEEYRYLDNSNRVLLSQKVRDVFKINPKEDKIKVSVISVNGKDPVILIEKR